MTSSGTTPRRAWLIRNFRLLTILINMIVIFVFLIILFILLT
jgi:hypothetical protein